MEITYKLLNNKKYSEEEVKTFNNKFNACKKRWENQLKSKNLPKEGKIIINVKSVEDFICADLPANQIGLPEVNL